MSDPKKNFVCPKCNTVIKDTERRWGKDTPCPTCARMEFEQYRAISEAGYKRIIEYTIQPTDSVAGIAKRFGVDLNKLIEINMQIYTEGAQAGIKIKIPVDHLHLEVVSDVLPEIESDEPGVQEERIMKFQLKLPSGELYQFRKLAFASARV